MENLASYLTELFLFLSLLLEFFKENASSVIAFCALVLTFHQFKLMSVHNKITLSPYLSTTVTTSHELAGEYAVQAFLINRGLGPAIIKTYRLWDGKTYHDLHQPSEFANLLQVELGELLDMQRSFFHVFRKESVVGANDTILLAAIYINLTPKAEAQLEDIERRLKLFHIYIDYETIYGDKGVYDSKVHLQTKTVL
jgi:hypothetical protein